VVCILLGMESPILSLANGSFHSVDDITTTDGTDMDDIDELRLKKSKRKPCLHEYVTT